MERRKANPDFISEQNEIELQPKEIQLKGNHAPAGKRKNKKKKKKKKKKNKSRNRNKKQHASSKNRQTKQTVKTNKIKK